MRKKNIFKPLVSVIINCHNASSFISKSINSVIKQKYKNWELIIYDNFSKDKTYSIIKRFIKDKRIKYYKSNSFLNLYHARNLAINKCKGKFVTFLDADDWWIDNKLDKQIRFLANKKKINIIYSNLFLYEEKKGKKKLFSKDKLYNGNITQKLLNNFKMPILTTLINKKIFNKYRFDKRYNIIGDFDLFIRLSLNQQILSIQEPLAYYRVHSSSMSTKRLDLNISELIDWVKENQKKKQFKYYNFSEIQKKINTLKIKNNLLMGYRVNVLKEIVKKPFKFENLKFVPLIFFPNKIVKKLFFL